MNIDIITQYILSIVPAVSAIMGMAVIVGVGVGKIRKANKLTEDKVNEMAKDNKLLKQELQKMSSENVLLKRTINKLDSKFEDVKIVKKKVK